MQGPADRTCLNCGRTFWSTGPGNRICPTCRYNQPTIPDAMIVRGRQRSTWPHRRDDDRFEHFAREALDARW